MSEKNDISIEVSSKSEKMSVGGILRKQRISMNLSVEKISKDLRINKAYIEAVENDNYNALPAAPYIRVYVKTIAEYLSLDSEKLLKQLSIEKGKIAGFTTMEISTGSKETSKIKVNISKQKKSGKSGFTALLVILLLVLAYFFIVRSGEWQSLESVTGDADAFAIITDGQDTIDIYTLADSLIRGDTLIIEETPAVVPEKMEITLQVVRDSSWVQIIADGIITFDRTLRAPSRIITATADDSVNVYAGGGSATVDIFINGKKISKVGATGIWTLTRDEIKNLTPVEWRRLKKVPQ